MYTISKNKPRKNKIFKRKEKKTGGGPGKKGLDKICSTISEMLTQQSLQNQYNHDASLHSDEPDDEEEDSNDTDEEYFAKFLH